MKKIKLIRSALLVVWLVCLINLAVPISSLLNYLLAFLVIAHVLEFFVFFKKFETNKVKNFFMVLVFGYLHVQQLDYEKRKNLDN
tara:strand:- start:52 stop:306 length:255 start_codon:yes stop_codon:yes gene_type:complete